MVKLFSSGPEAAWPGRFLLLGLAGLKHAKNESGPKGPRSGRLIGDVRFSVNRRRFVVFQKMQTKSAH
jgi:hypothetical protein